MANFLAQNLPLFAKFELVCDSVAIPVARSRLNITAASVTIENVVIVQGGRAHGLTMRAVTVSGLCEISGLSIACTISTLPVC